MAKKLTSAELRNQAVKVRSDVETVLPIPGEPLLDYILPSRWLAHFEAIPDNGSLIQINSHILLLHCVHRNDRGRRD